MPSIRNIPAGIIKRRTKKDPSKQREDQVEVLEKPTVCDIIRSRHATNICGCCGKKKKLIVRVGGSEEANLKTIFPNQTSYVCTTEDCSLFIDLTKVRNWKLRKCESSKTSKQLSQR